MPSPIRVKLVATCPECEAELEYAGQLNTDVDFDMHATIPPSWRILRRGMEQVACCPKCADKLVASDDGWRPIDDREVVIS